MNVELNQEEIILAVNTALESADEAATTGQKFWARYGAKLDAYLDANQEVKGYDYYRDQNINLIKDLKEGLTFASPPLVAIHTVAKTLRLMFLLDHALGAIRKQKEYGAGDKDIKQICIGSWPEGGFRNPDFEPYKVREQEFAEALR